VAFGIRRRNPNQTISFYLGLDPRLLLVTIRDATEARGLDDVLRLLWGGITSEGRASEDGFQAAAEEVAGRPLDDFFARYVAGTDELPYDEILGIVGLTARRAPNPDRPAATFGWRLRAQGEEVTISGVLPDGPAVSAGIMRDDVLISIAGEPVESGDLEPFLSGRSPGDAVA
jgi:predicted metalloprotease with PDZ domain